MADQAQQTTATSPSSTQSVPQKSTNVDADLDQVAVNTKQKIHQDPTKGQKLAPTEPLQDLVIDIETDLLHEITKRLQQKQMTKETAQKLAKEFLSYLPIQDQRDLLAKLTKFSQENMEVQGIYLKYAKPVEETERIRKLELMSQHIEQGNIEHALAVAKGEKHE